MTNHSTRGCEYGVWNVTLGGCSNNARVIVTHPILDDIWLCLGHAEKFAANGYPVRDA